MKNRRLRRWVRLHAIYLAAAASALVVLLGYQLMAWAVHLRGLK